MADQEYEPDHSHRVRKLKQCYYELLNIDMDASEEEIRQAYKYQALRWHPDKNQSDPETAAQTFLEVQAAYAILTDKKKRAWYDKFRDRILQGAQDDEIVDDACIDLEDFMTTSCYAAYDDSEDGFYSVYRGVFDQLMREELPYEEEDDPTPPGFGTSESPYEEVHAFYAFWSSFCTKKTFDHLMKFDVLEAPNRRTLRAMEKENTKIRETAKKCRNEQIRRLVAFVRKKDKRVAKRKHELKEISEENRRKAQEGRRKQIESFASQTANHGESEWSSMKSLERSLNALERRYDREHAADGKRNGTANGVQNDDEEGEDILILSEEEDAANADANASDSEKEKEKEDVDEGMICVACDKRFKSRPAFDNHSRSKKHQSNVAALKKALMEDDSLISSS